MKEEIKQELSEMEQQGIIKPVRESEPTGTGKQPRVPSQTIRKIRVCLDPMDLNLNPEKCNIKQQEINFYGVICGKDGVKPNPKKVTALKQMSAPRNRQELLSFLGLATYNPGQKICYNREIHEVDLQFDDVISLRERSNLFFSILSLRQDPLDLSF